MIGYLRGVVVDRRVRRDQSAEVIVDVAGVGYRVIAPSATLLGWGDDGAEVRIWVHTHVREDAIILYGFSSRDQRGCFETLIGTHGVGPAVALAILSVHTPEALRRAVGAGDLDALMLVPGIGKKTAARLVVELENRLDGDGADSPFGADLMGSDLNSGGGDAGRRRELREALAALGYAPEEIRYAIGRVPAEGSVEVLLRAALGELAGPRPG